MNLFTISNPVMYLQFSEVQLLHRQLIALGSQLSTQI